MSSSSMAAVHILDPFGEDEHSLPGIAPLHACSHPIHAKTWLVAAEGGGGGARNAKRAGSALSTLQVRTQRHWQLPGSRAFPVA